MSYKLRSKKTSAFVKKIEYVIGAIKSEIATSTSSWNIRHEQLRIASFESLIDRMKLKLVKSEIKYSNQ